MLPDMHIGNDYTSGEPPQEKLFDSLVAGPEEGCYFSRRAMFPDALAFLQPELPRLGLLLSAFLFPGYAFALPSRRRLSRSLLPRSVGLSLADGR